MLDITRIREILPHRYPMLLVDRVLEIDENGAVGIKNVSANESFFQGHFPDYPVMPGVLVVEALAQMGALLAMNSIDDASNKLVLFAAIDECRFRRQVVPGDQLRLEVSYIVKKARVGKMRGVARVDGKVAAEGVLMCQIVDKPAPAA